MNPRSLALIIGVLDTIALVVAVSTLLPSASDPATRGLDNAADAAIALIYAVTALPALVLVWRRRAPRTALTLAIAFPAVFAAAFLAAVIAYI